MEVNLNYRRGLHNITPNTNAWLLPDGSWGWSNSGLIVGEGESLMFDTLYDAKLTQEMLDGIKSITDESPVKRLVISHPNGDHYYGNQVMGADVEIISTTVTDELMRAEDPKKFAKFYEEEGARGDFFRSFFSPFDHDSVVVRAADTTFDKELTLDVGGVEVQFKDLGPAHTRSDVVAWVPEESVLYTADLLFVGGTPIVWAGPTQNWIDALDAMAALGAKTIVPGHGPITDGTYLGYMRSYLEYVLETATDFYNRGVNPVEAAKQLDLGAFKNLNEHGRIVQNVLNVYGELDPTVQLEVPEIMKHIAILEGF